MKRRFLQEEGGFTLPEVLVTMMLMLTVMFALYSIFDMSIRVFSFGRDKVEAVENAREGLDKMAREIRAAYPTDRPSGNRTLLATRNADSITFGNDLDGDRTANDAGEQITYRLNAGGNTLLRNDQPVVEYVSNVDATSGALTFQYLQADGVTTATSEANTYIVHIKLEVAVDRGIQEQPVTQVLETDVALRNRGG